MKGLATGALLLFLTVFAGSAALAIGTDPTALTIGASELQDLGIYPDKTVAAVDQASDIGQEDAVATASRYFGRSDAPSLVLHAQAWRIADEPLRIVWVVIFEGGSPPVPDGPTGMPRRVVTVEYTGAVIDADSGELLRTFGRGH
jgi:hypothetical protein